MRHLIYTLACIVLCCLGHNVRAAGAETTSGKVVKVYDLSDLVTEWRSTDELVTVLHLIVPGIKGPESSRPSFTLVDAMTGKRCLLVRASPQVHKEIERVLTDLKKLSVPVSPKSQESRIDPEVKLTPRPGKEVTVIVRVAAAREISADPDLHDIERDLWRRFTKKLAKRFADNGEKIKFVPFGKVKSYSDREGSRKQLGRHFNAEYVIDLEIKKLALFEGSYKQLFRGRGEVQVRVLDLADPEEPTYDECHETEHPASGPIDAAALSVASFRGRFVDRLARDLSRLFCAYPADERLELP